MWLMSGLHFFLLVIVKSKGTRLVKKGELRVNFQLAFEDLEMLIFTFAIISCSPPQHEARTALSTYSWDVERAVESIFS